MKTCDIVVLAVFLILIEDSDTDIEQKTKRK